MKQHLTEYKFNRQNGLTLIELMIAMVISAILMIGIVNIYSATKQAYKISEEFSVLQENARVAFRFLTKDIRMAGYLGCAWSTGDNVSDTLKPTAETEKDDFITGFNIGLEGFEATGTGPNTAIDLATIASTFNRTPYGNITGYRAGSDILVVRHASDSGVKISSNKESANFWIETGGVTSFYTNSDGEQCHSGSGICEDDILMISDCSKSKIFKAGNGMSHNSSKGIKVTHPGTDNDPSSWGGNSGSASDWFAPGDSEILRAGTYAYFVGTGASGQPALMRLEDRADVATELVEGVENMQVLYGIDGSGDGIPELYDVAPTVSSTNIVSVRLSLLLSTPNEIPKRANDTKEYKLISKDDNVNVRVTSASDRRMRKVFTTTIKLRNKGLTDE